MPIEIRELVIKMVVEEAAAGNTSKAGSNGGQVNGTNTEERLVNICVEKVFEILKEKNER